jgi:hypothetical protein
MRLIHDADLPEQFRAHAMYALGTHAPVQAFRDYCRANRIYYYARPRETFYRTEAFQLAERAGCDKLLLEDLS